MCRGVGTMKNYLFIPCLVLWATTIGGVFGTTILEKLAQDTDLSEVSAKHQETEDATKRTTGPKQSVPVCANHKAVS